MTTKVYINFVAPTAPTYPGCQRLFLRGFWFQVSIVTRSGSWPPSDPDARNKPLVPRVAPTETEDRSLVEFNTLLLYSSFNATAKSISSRKNQFYHGKINCTYGKIIFELIFYLLVNAMDDVIICMYVCIYSQLSLLRTSSGPQFGVRNSERP